MAPSDVRPRILVLAAVAAPIALCIAACGQVTGLADDYRYDLEGDAGADGSDAASIGDRARDAGNTCVDTDRSRAVTAITAANGSDLTTACRSCLADSCCAQISTCASNSACSQAMQCVFGCQKAIGNKRDCLSRCDAGFTQRLGSCVQASCASPTCQLQ